MLLPDLVMLLLSTLHLWGLVIHLVCFFFLNCLILKTRNMLGLLFPPTVCWNYFLPHSLYAGVIFFPSIYAGIIFLSPPCMLELFFPLLCMLGLFSPCSLYDGIIFLPPPCMLGLFFPLPCMLGLFCPCWFWLWSKCNTKAERQSRSSCRCLADLPAPLLSNCIKGSNWGDPFCV